MPVTTQTGKRYMPGLDGLRAIAVLSVIAYHLNFGWAQGGFLGCCHLLCPFGIFNYQSVNCEGFLFFAKKQARELV